jgi:TolB-like protein/tetratricopeptide (TPR) repeat protein
VHSDSLEDQLRASIGAAYALEHELGGGGMSRVFVAEERALGRRVVIKVLLPELAESLSADRFAREIRFAAMLQEPHIVPVLSAGVTTEGLPYYTMPFVRGESLRARLERGSVPAAEALEILRDVARALLYAHAQGVVHRDIKPENILLHEGTAVVTDFGIAKAVSASTTTAPGSMLTAVGTSLGTPAYMAPEQAVGDHVDHRADLYAWGVVAYELLARRHPFSDKSTSQQLIAAHIAEVPRPLAGTGSSVPLELARCVMRTLEKDPALRPASASELLETLDSSVPSRTGSRRAIAAAIAAVALVAAVGLWFTRSISHRATRAESPATISTLAVLPFVNLGGDVRDEYFSDGMTDELAHALGTLPGVRLAGRSSAYAYKGKSEAASRIGQALGVAGVIQGTVQRAGDRVRLRVELIGANDNKVRWSGSFERSAGDILALQDSLTAAVIAAVAPTLAGTAAGAVASTSRGTSDVNAYDFYMRGQYLWRRRGIENLVTAADLFGRAVSRDPQFARGYSGLALVLGILPFYVSANPDSLARHALGSADRAIALDSMLAEAHLARGRALHDLLRLSDARVEYSRALSLEPRNASALQWFGELEYNAGRIDSAIAIERHAEAIDPGSAIPSWLITRQLLGVGRIAEAVVQGKRARDLDPSLSRIRIVYGAALVLSGQLDSALVELEGAHRRTPEEPGAVAYLAFAYAASARWSDVDRLRAEEVARGPGRANHAQLAAIAVLKGDHDAAIAELELSVARHDLIGVTVFPGCEPLYAPLRADARFRALLSRLKIIPCT